MSYFSDCEIVKFRESNFFIFKLYPNCFSYFGSRFALSSCILYEFF